MPNINGGVLDGVRRIGGRFRDLIIDGGLPGAPLGYRLRGATQYGPPQTETWRPGDEVPDRAGNRWVCTAGGTPGTWTASVIAVAPSSDRSGVTSAVAINAAVGLLPASGGVIRLAPTAQWYIACGLVIINRSGVYIDATGCFINAVGAGDVFRMYDSSTYLSRTIQGGGILGMPIIDGTNTTGNSSAFHAGDILQLAVNVQAMNFRAGTTSKGVWLDNNYYWTEQAWGRVYAQYCAAGVVFDNSANPAGTATGSYDRDHLSLNVVSGGYGDCVVLQNGARSTNGDISINGNMSTGVPSSRYAVLRITGSNTANGSSQFVRCRLSIGVELDDNTNFTPYTIVFGAAGNAIYECAGLIDFSSGTAAFLPSNNSGQFLFTGPVFGDANLFPMDYQNPGTQTITANAQTIFTGFVGTTVSTNAAAFTGLILQAGSLPGEKFTLVNKGTGSLTFAASGTSHVADGVSDVVAVNTAATYVWDAVSALWYRVH